ncbi:MAG: hypothetical protein KKA79_06210, partial [Nanoarchaeota archaeon]|nr:hypothetical protein [Nanoarchaeota archaeon]
VETKKQELDYIARLTEEYWDQLKDIFKPKKNIGTRDLEILLFKLGWVDILEDDDKYIFYVTPTGKEIVDDLKTIRKQKFDKYPTKQQKRRKKKPKL